MITKDILLATLKSFNRTVATASTEDVTAQIISRLILLPYMEKCIIYLHYIQAEKWVRISVKNNISVTTCKQIRNRGLETLLLCLNGGTS